VSATTIREACACEVARLEAAHLRDLLRRVLAVECVERDDGSLAWGRVALSAEFRAECKSALEGKP
jgi:hypothetical protein